MHKKPLDQIKTIIMGIESPYNLIKEFDVAENGCEHIIYTHGHNFSSFAASVYQDSKLILSGGSCSTGITTGRNTVFELKFRINEVSKNLESTMKTLPNLAKLRYKHC